MAKQGKKGRAIVEVVGIFADRATFKAAVEELLAGGFERPDLSVLDSHESLGAAGGRNEAWRTTLSGLVGEAKYIEPLTAAGLILLASGFVGAAVAGAVAAGVGGMALYELLSDVSATPDTEEFKRALEGGMLLLWVRAEDPVRQALARDILKRHGASHVRVQERWPHED